MAGSIGTNVTADGQAEMELLKRIIGEIEKKIARKEITMQDKLNMKMAKFLLQENNIPNRSNIEKKHYKALEKLLIEHEIPYYPIRNERGDVLLLTDPKDKEMVMQLQETVFTMDGSLFRSQTQKNILNAGLQNNEKEAIKITVKNAAEFSILQAKLSNHQIVYGASEKAGVYEVIISPGAILNNSDKDLVSFEMEWALAQTLAGDTFGNGDGEVNLHDLRAKQGAYDESQIQNFLKSDFAILTDVNGNSNYYIEKHKNTLLAYQKDENGEWKEVSRLDDLQAQDAFVRNYAAKITDMYTYKNEELQNGLTHIKLSRAEAQRDLPDGFVNGDRRKYTTDKLSPKDRMIKEISDKELDGPGGLLYIIKTRAYQNLRNRIPDQRWKVLTKEQQYTLLKEEIGRLLHPDNAKETPEYKEFLMKDISGLSPREKYSFCEELASHFTDEHEHGKMEIDISRVNIKDKLWEIELEQREKAQIREQEAQEEMDRENENERS